MTQGAQDPAAEALGEDSSPASSARARKPPSLPTQGDIFHDERAARRHLEALRWPGGATCPHCLGRDRVRALCGRSLGSGLHFCLRCRRKFTVRVGTVYERSHIPLHKWLLAVQLTAGAEQHPTVNALSRAIGIQYRSAGFMADRIRRAACLASAPGTLNGSASPLTDATVDSRRDAILHRMLSMPYRPHEPQPLAAHGAPTVTENAEAARASALPASR